MLTAKQLIVVAILLLTFAVAAWSKLRFVDDEDFAPQRWRASEHPQVRRNT